MTTVDKEWAVASPSLLHYFSCVQLLVRGRAVSLSAYSGAV